MRARALRQSSPDAERTIWSALRDRRLDGYKFRRQHPIGAYFADFACVDAMLVVELDGGQHFESAAIEADKRRTLALNANAFEVLRFDVRQALTGNGRCVERHPRLVAAPSPSPQPSPASGRGSH